MGKRNSNVLEINGKRYDATSGALLEAGGHHSRSIDGMVARGRAAASTSQHVVQPQMVAPAIHHKTAHPNMSDVRQVNHHKGAHRPEHGKTLMRRAVHKPAPGLKLHVATPTDILAPSPDVSVVPKWSISQIDPKRLRHAQHVERSRFIQRFAPDEPEVPPRPSIPLSTGPKPIAPGPQPVPAPAHQAHNRSMDVFQRALKHANAHEQPTHNPRAARKAAKAEAKRAKKATRPVHHRAMSVALASLAVLLLTGFFAYQNRADLIMRVADAKAGFHANLPGYKPAGFAAAKFSYGAGLVAVNFHNGTTGSSYSLVQKTSDWDSQTLLDSYVSTQSHTYQTLQSGGRTIYLYGNNNAAWVNGGVLYQLTSNGSLTTNDVLNIATSV